MTDKLPDFFNDSIEEVVRDCARLTQKDDEGRFCMIMILAINLKYIIDRLSALTDLHDEKPERKLEEIFNKLFDQNTRSVKMYTDQSMGFEINLEEKQKKR